MLHIRLLGDVRLSYGSAPVTGVRSSRLRSLLAYLVLHGEAPQFRHYIASLFWPESTGAQARTRLQRLLRDLRAALPEHERFIEIDRHTLAWRRDAPCTVDVIEFRRTAVRAMEAMTRKDRSAARSAFDKAAALYTGELLPDCADAWIEPVRQHLRRAFTRVLDQHIVLLQKESDYRAAIRQARRLLRHEPVREATYRTLIRLHALDGDRAAALRIYRACEVLLLRELDVEPGPVTRMLYRRILDEESPAVALATSRS